MTSSSSRDSQSVQASRSDIRAITGLTAEEVDRRIREEGPNELATTKPRTWLTIAWDVVREPMLLLLLAAGSLNFLLGEPQDGFILLSFVIVVIASPFSRSDGRSARSRPCGTSRVRGRSCCVTACRRASPVATWCAATSYCSRRAIAFQPMVCCSSV